MTLRTTPATPEKAAPHPTTLQLPDPEQDRRISRPTLENIARLRQQVADAQNALAEETQRIQRECSHPLSELDITEGAVNTHSGAGITHELYIRCKACLGFFKRTVEFHHG